MYEGGITVTDGKGHVILAGNIWALLLVGVFTKSLHLDPEKMRVFIDGKEVEKPEAFENDNRSGGDPNGN